MNRPKPQESQQRSRLPRSAALVLDVEAGAGRADIGAGAAAQAAQRLLGPEGGHRRTTRPGRAATLSRSKTVRTLARRLSLSCWRPAEDSSGSAGDNRLPFSRDDLRQVSAAAHVGQQDVAACGVAGAAAHRGAEAVRIGAGTGNADHAASGQAGREKAVGGIPGEDGGQGGEGRGIAGAQAEDHGPGQRARSRSRISTWPSALRNEKQLLHPGKDGALGDCTVCTWSRLTSSKEATQAKSTLSPVFFGARMPLAFALPLRRSAWPAPRG